MTQHHGTGAIPWREWNEEAFEAARSEDKPVLLTMGATWCHWCHVMDEQAYSDSAGHRSGQQPIHPGSRRC